MDVTAFEAGGLLGYLAVFLAGAIPVLEVLVVIPAGVLAGLAPVPTAVIAAAGNLSTVVVVAVAGDRLLAWWRRRRSARAGAEPDATGEAAPSRKVQRARELARRWGVPGLAFLAPITVGTHIATVAALATGAPTRRVLWWMTGGLVVWAVVIGAAAAAGVELFT